MKNGKTLSRHITRTVENFNNMEINKDEDEIDAGVRLRHSHYGAE